MRPSGSAERFGFFVLFNERRNQSGSFILERSLLYQTPNTDLAFAIMPGKERVPHSAIQTELNLTERA